MTKVKKRKKRHSKKVYFMRRMLVLAILLILIAVIGTALTYFFKEINSLRKKHNSTLEDYKVEATKLDLKIEEREYQWDRELSYTNNPNKIVVHHSASESTTVEDIDRIHRENGWSGIGYHYFIDKKGKIYEGRPENAIGAHAYKNNNNTLGICLEGNFENQLVEDSQYNSLIDLLSYLSIKYPIKDIVGHRDVFETLCPGKNLKIETIKSDVINKLKNNK